MKWRGNYSILAWYRNIRRVGYISEVTTDVLWDIRFEMEKKYEDYR